MVPHMTCDVLVVGARCAGASVAMLLARRGLRVVAIDRDAYGSDTFSTHALMRGAVVQLHRWGVLPAIMRRGTPPVRKTTFYYGSDIEEVTIRPSAGVSALYAPRRTVLDASLVDAARAAGAQVRHGCSLVDLVRHIDGRIVGAVIEDGDGQHRLIRAGLVIGADGVGSTVARLTEAQLTHTAAHGCVTVYGYAADLDLQGYHWGYNPGVTAGFIPTNDGQHCVFVGMPPARYKTEVRLDLVAGFQNVLTEALPTLANTIAAPRGVGTLRVFAGRKGFLRKAQGPGWALVGDAGYFRDPITAHGITDALRDAEILANAVVRGTDSALADYESTRDELSHPMLNVTEAIASFAWELDTVRKHHHALNMLMKAEVARLTELASGPAENTAPQEKAA